MQSQVPSPKQQHLHLFSSDSVLLEAIINDQCLPLSLKSENIQRTINYIYLDLRIYRVIRDKLHQELDYCRA